jgi:AcrR family transcriptional regulator
MAAVVQSIAEVGYQKTTAAEIARRAGVTWGAVQHHFGDKDGILAAVLEDTFARFAERLGGIPAGASLEARVDRFVDRAWDHFSSAHYRTTFEILLNLPANPDTSWQDRMLAAWSRIWSAYFPGRAPSRGRAVGLIYYTISVLTGLAATQMLSGRSVGRLHRELGYLKDTLVRELGRAGRYGG